MYKRYASLFAQLDTRLLEVQVKVGETVFNFDSTGVPGGRPSAQSAPSPMAVIQQMLTGGGGQSPPAGPPGRGGAGGGGFDMNAIMNMLARMPPPAGGR